MIERVELSWNHPVKGSITEVACRDHEREILRALRTLGIGGFAQPADATMACLRCTHRGGQARIFLNSAVVHEGARTDA